MNSADEPTGAEPSGFWSAIANYDWLKIPGAVRAIARVVEGTGDAGAAWIDVARAKGEQTARSIRDTTEARSKTLSVYTDAAIQLGVTDKAMIQRTVNYTAVKGIREQQNREAVAIETIALLSDEDQMEETPPPDDDWMNIFVSYAERASTERMQKHWAAILAGEVRQPGRFSFATLQIMSVMDTQLAEAVTKVRGWLAGGNVPMIPSKSRGKDFQTVLQLSDCGILSVIGRTTIPASGGTVYMFADSAITVVPQREIRFQIARLTRAGSEIMSLIEPRADPVFIEEFSEFLRNQGAEVQPSSVVRDRAER